MTGKNMMQYIPVYLHEGIQCETLYYISHYLSTVYCC